MRPLVADVGGFLLPVAAGVLLFRIGRGFRHWPWLVRGVIVLVALAALSLALSSAFRFAPAGVEDVAFVLGGMTTLLCWVAVFLLGVVWGVPGRSTSSTFLGLIAGVALVVIAIESSGRLWWRFISPDIWDRTADSTGLLEQSSGLTCSPASAVMLLHQHGVPAGEGEMAYLAGTSPLGTDAAGIMRALQEKVGSRGWRVEAGHTTFDECLRRGEPFLAHVQGRYLGHAVLVAQIAPDEVTIFDPASGQAGTLNRQQFEGEWDGTAVRIVR